MRTVTMKIEIEARADASESRIKEALLKEMQGWIRGRIFAYTEDRKSIRVTEIREAHRDA